MDNDLTVEHVKALQSRLRYVFKNPGLLKKALTHSSFGQEKKCPDNERLEFIGDSFLEAVVSEYLFQDYPEFDEGELSRLRGNAVSSKNLKQMAEKIKLGRFLFLGKGEEKRGGRLAESNLVGAFEALFGAMFLDSNYYKAKKVFLSLFKGAIKSASSIQNYKGLLQEACDRDVLPRPMYKTEEIKNDNKTHRFYTEVIIQAKVFGSGDGKTKQEAEVSAAKTAFKKLKRK